MKKALLVLVFLLLGFFIFFAARSPVKSSPSVSASITSSQPSYAPTDIMKFVFTNTSEQPEYFSDHQSNCTVLMLERLVKGKWQQENQCGLTTPSITFSLDSKKDTPLELDPLPSGWAKGSYRASVVLHDKAGTTGSVTIQSSTFQVQ